MAMRERVPGTRRVNTAGAGRGCPLSAAPAELAFAAAAALLRPVCGGGQAWGLLQGLLQPEAGGGGGLSRGPAPPTSPVTFADVRSAPRCPSLKVKAAGSSSRGFPTLSRGPCARGSVDGRPPVLSQAGLSPCGPVCVPSGRVTIWTCGSVLGILGPLTRAMPSPQGRPVSAPFKKQPRRLPGAPAAASWHRRARRVWPGGRRESGVSEGTSFADPSLLVGPRGPRSRCPPRVEAGPQLVSRWASHPCQSVHF